MDVKAHLPVQLRLHPKQAGDEGELILDVSLPHPVYLPLANRVHHFVALERSPCRFKRKVAHPRLDQPLDKTVVLLHQIVEVFDLPQFDRLGKDSSGFELDNRFGIGRILLDIDDARSGLRGVRISRSSRLSHLFAAQPICFLPSRYAMIGASQLNTAMSSGQGEERQLAVFSIPDRR